MLGTLFRYLTKYLLLLTLGITGGLLLIFLSTEFARYLTMAAGGRIPSSFIAYLMMLQMPKLLGLLLTHSKTVNFKKQVRSLNEMENELSLIHGDIAAIGCVAEGFFESLNREAAFENLSKHYGELVSNVESLMVEEAKLKKLL